MGLGDRMDREDRRDREDRMGKGRGWVDEEHTDTAAQARWQNGDFDSTSLTLRLQVHKTVFYE